MCVKTGRHKTSYRGWCHDLMSAFFSYNQLTEVEGRIRGYETLVYLLAESHRFRIQLLGVSS